LLNKPSNFFIKTILLTTLAMIAFAANSILCRFALGNRTIDASSFAIIRLISGAIVLFTILKISSKKNNTKKSGSWTAGLMLFLYAVTFSFAYISLNTGTGALILFGSVQITMILMAIISGYRLNISEWIGVLIAFLGFVYLVLPGVSSPSLLGFFLMTIAGIAWGIYTIRGQGSVNPLVDTTYNFLRTVPIVIILAVLTIKNIHYSYSGVLLAMLSGGVASGIGYTIWYMALRGLTATQAAVVQLFVPVIAAIGGVIFMSELITLRLLLSAIMILGGISTVFLGRYHFLKSKLYRKHNRIR